MSRNIFHSIGKGLLLWAKEELNPDTAMAFFAANCIIVGGHAGYAYTTDVDSQVTIANKYTMTKNGYTDFMVVDSVGKHYNVNNSVWYWKWDSVEEWDRLKLNEKVSVRYYGYRIPILGTFPNIYNVSPFANKNG